MYVNPKLPMYRWQKKFGWTFFYLNELMQERRNSSALAMELRLSCTNPSICCPRDKVGMFVYIHCCKYSETYVYQRDRVMCKEKCF